MVRADGGVVWFHDITTVDMRAGKPVGLHGVFIDITERKNAETVVRDSEHRFRTLAENSSVGFWQITLEGYTTYINPAMCRMLEIAAPAELEGKTFHAFFTGESLERVKREHAKRLAGISSSYEVQIVGTRGTVRNVILSGAPLLTGAGRVYGLIGTFLDITQRKTAELAVRDSEERLSAVINNTPNVAIEGFDLEGRVLFWNKAAETIFGVTERRALGKTLDHLIFDAPTARQFAATLREINRTNLPTAPTEWEFVNQLTGQRGVVYSTIFPTRHAHGKRLFVCMDIDITDRKRAETALQHSVELQRMMLSELDHRVRNNLASLGALIDISMRDKTDVRDFAESIRRRVQAMSAVHSLLSRAHWLAVEFRSLVDTLTPVDLGDALALDGPDILITPRQVTALGMILQELIANSLKYGALRIPSGRVDLKWRVDPQPTAKGWRMELTWRERGGPPSAGAPPRPGQGTGLILGFVRSELRGEAHLSYPPSGASHRLVLNLDVAQ
jgi:PAS domain S-box-containing protein